MYNRKERALLWALFLSALALASYAVGWGWTEAARVSTPEKLGYGIGICFFFNVCFFVFLYLRKK